MTDENYQSKGFAYVHFETQNAADHAILRLNGEIMAGKKVIVSRFVPRSQPTDSDGKGKLTSVVIIGFGHHLDEQKLSELCSRYGKVTSSKVESREAKQG